MSKTKASSILSDGSRSKVSALDPTFAKGTYDLTEHGIEVSERKHSYNTSHRDETSSYVSKKYQSPLVQQKSFDVADTYNSNYYMDFDFTDKMDAAFGFLLLAHVKPLDPETGDGPEYTLYPLQPFTTWAASDFASYEGFGCSLCIAPATFPFVTYALPSFVPGF